MKPKNIPVKKSENAGKTFKRLMSYVLKEYKIHCFVVLIAILISSLSSVYGSLFLKTLIDDYIAPFLNETNPNFAPFTCIDKAWSYLLYRCNCKLSL